MNRSFIISFVFIAVISVKVKSQSIYDFELKNTDGKLVSLKNYPEAQGFIIVFTCNHCPFAKLYPSRLNSLNQKYSKLKIPLIAISSTDTMLYAEDGYDNMGLKAKKEKFNFPYLYDNTQLTAKAYHASKTPEVFLLWKNGDAFEIKYSGAIDDNGAEPNEVKEKYIEEAIEDLLQHKSVRNPATKSIGCKIYFRN